ncbi:MAG: hypothetical protein NPIRA06_23390 [Nitrospirales bacterium]|nr:MAG: hypothetical protein NPIRA06_23390 [Nitrospirales bacterium]
MEPVDLFYSYAHEDESLREELAGHLKIMERRGVIRPWHDRCLAPGQTWDQEINTQLAAADLVLLLISADFINSDYIWGKELDVAMKRHASKEASVVPVMLRSVDITDAPFAALQGLPTDLRPVTSWPNRDEAWTDVAKGIRRTVEQIQAGWTEKQSPMPAVVGLARSGSATPSTPSGTSDSISRPILGSGDSLPPGVGEPASDPILERVLREVSTQVTEAARVRGTRDIDPAKAQRYALTLIDAPDQKRILWVDNRPANNRFETSALAKLQIEVVTVTSTDAALARIASDPEPFDLVLSDWQRPELHLDTLNAGIHLLRQLRARHLTMPVVFYHGSSKERDRTARRELALREGAFGEAVMPDELLGLVTSALGLD